LRTSKKLFELNDKEPLIVTEEDKACIKEKIRPVSNKKRHLLKIYPYRKPKKKKKKN
jgi:hypothetical protein